MTKKVIKPGKKEKTEFSYEIILIYAGVLAGLLLLYWLRAVLMPFAIAFVLAYILNPAISYFEKKGVRRIIVITIYFFIIFTAAFTALTFFIDFAGKEINIIQQKLPAVSEKVKTITGDISAAVSGVFPNIKKTEIDAQISGKIAKITEDISSNVVGLFSGLISGISSIFARIMDLLIIILVLFILLKDWEKIKTAVKKYAPKKYHLLAGKLVSSVNVQVSMYLRGQFLVALSVGVLAGMGLMLAGFEYFFVLGVITGLANLIPVVGPFTGMCVGTVLSIFSHEPFFTSAIKVLAVLLTVQLLDNIFITPLIIGKAVKIHTVTVLLVLALGWYFLGIIGMLIAIPFYTTMKFVIAEIYNYHGSPASYI